MSALQAVVVPALAAEVQAVLAEPARLRLVYQPVVDLTYGSVAGYESLARFDSPLRLTPDLWFQAAWDTGVGADLEMLVLRRALARRHHLPPNSFLTVNVSPQLLLTDTFKQQAEGIDWHLIVLELTEHAPVDDYPCLERSLDTVRRLGALLAIDDAGAGYASLSHVLALRPNFVKLDRGLVTDIDRDAAKRAAVEMFGEFACRIDAWIIAEGVERAGELDELRRLGIPLGQGWFLARPAAPWAPVEAKARRAMRAAEQSAVQGAPLEPLAERCASLPAGASLAKVRAVFEQEPAAMALAAPDIEGRPHLLVRRDAVERGQLDAVPALVVYTRADVADALKRAMTRPIESRYDPLIAHDDLGRYFGMIPIDRLIRALIEEHQRERS